MNVINQAHGDNWALYCGDSAEVLTGLRAECIDLSLYSPPFSQLYVYSASERDLGNSANDQQFFRHYDYILREVLRVTKPGRIAAVHVAQVPLQKARDGAIGLKDFRGDVIRAHQTAGWVFQGEAVIQKNPQAQAIRTKSKGLLFVQMHKDSTWSRPALADYLLIFRKPGANLVPVIPDITNEEWIQWAHPIWQSETQERDVELLDAASVDLIPGTALFWYNIRETRTLNVQEARNDADERHVCPLQLDTIERCVRLWSNRGETVLSPFAGIGSEGHVALELGRRFIGIELKSDYWEVAARNLRAAEGAATQPRLFSLDEDAEEQAEEEAVA